MVLHYATESLIFPWVPINFDSDGLAQSFSTWKHNEVWPDQVFSCSWRTAVSYQDAILSHVLKATYRPEGSNIAASNQSGEWAFHMWLTQLEENFKYWIYSGFSYQSLSTQKGE